MKRNWTIEKVIGKKRTGSHWLHWWSITDLEKLRNDVVEMINKKQETGDYHLPETKILVATKSRQN